MISYAFVDADGYVTGAGSGPKLREGALELPEGITAMASVEMMLLDGQWQRRPDIALPLVIAFGTTGRAARFEDLPSGTIAAILDVDFGCSIATEPEVKGVLNIELPEPGRYRIAVTPPRPYLPMTLDIEVNG